MRNIRRILGPALLTAGVIALIGTTAGAQRSQTAQPGIRLGEADDNARGQTKRFTQRQLDNVDTRIAIANAIVGRFEGEASRMGTVSIWRQSTLETLFGLSLPALQYVQQNAHSVESLSAVVREAANDPNLIGDPNADLVYTPINPCRYIDTRGGPIVDPATPRAYDLVNNGSVYGGVASCSLLQNTTAAIAANITITQPAGGVPAFLAVKPTLAAPTTSWMNWYELGAQLANAGVFTVDQSGAGTEFFILVSSPTHVIVDFFGFFAEPEATALDCVNIENSVVVANNAQINWPPGLVATCPAGYTISGGGNRYTGGTEGFWWWNSYPSGNTWVTAGRNTTGGNVTVVSTARCCRVPGR